MNFYFFQTGNEIDYASLLVNSIRKTNPKSRIIQVSDIDTPEIDNIHDCLRFSGDKKNICKFRFDCYSKIDFEKNTENIFLDTDMIVLEELSPKLIFQSFEDIFCLRHYPIKLIASDNDYFKNKPEYLNKTFSEVMPILACFIATKNINLFKTMNKMYESLDDDLKYWYGDQIILKKYCETYKKNIGLVSEYYYGNLDIKIFKDGQFDKNLLLENKIKIIHFKGENRKKHMRNFYLDWFEKN